MKTLFLLMTTLLMSQLSFSQVSDLTQFEREEIQAKITNIANQKFNDLMNKAQRDEAQAREVL
jgi:hypothetical protein